MLLSFWKEVKYRRDYMYKIGEFSKIVNIPVRTLRYYADIGVLVPNKVDVYTRYKYYDDTDIITCEKIKLLKALNFSLEEIKRYKDSLSISILEEKKKEIKEEIKLLNLKYERINIIEDSLKNKDSNNKKEDKVLRRIK